MARMLAGMRVLITGASSGIGEALMRELATQGARCAGMARRAEQLQATVASLPGQGHSAIVGDVSRTEDCERAVKTAVSQMGGLDTLVCNAGYGLFRETLTTTRADWDAILATNLHGTIDCIRAAVPVMQQQELRQQWRGQVVIVSSILARRGAARCAAYCATKAAQLSLAEALRLELREHAIAVTSVHPVGTRTEFFTSAADRTGATAHSRSASFDQSADHVARRIRRAIQRPSPEVWPMRSARWFSAWCGLMPGLADRIVGKLSPK